MKKKLLFRMAWFPLKKATRADLSSGTDDIIMGSFGSKKIELIEYFIAMLLISFSSSVFNATVLHILNLRKKRLSWQIGFRRRNRDCRLQAQSEQLANKSFRRRWKLREHNWSTHCYNDRQMCRNWIKSIKLNWFALLISLRSNDISSFLFLVCSATRNLSVVVACAVMDFCISVSRNKSLL